MLNENDGTTAKQVVELTGSIELHSAGVEDRLKKIETTLETAKGARKGFWEIVQAVLPGVVLAVVGYFLNDTVNHAFQERQLESANVKEMQSLIADLEKSDVDRDVALSKASQLAAFGQYAVPVFTTLLEAQNPNTQLAAQKGLLLVGARVPAPVCSDLANIVRNRSGLYRWQTHLHALEILGDLSCKSALPSLKEYGDNLSEENLRKWVSNAPEPKEFAQVQDQASKTKQRLEALEKAGK